MSRVRLALGSGGALLMMTGCAGGGAAAPATPVPPSSCQIHRLPMPDNARQGAVQGASPDGRTLVDMLAAPAREWRGLGFTPDDAGP
jgi:hypothetical protein